MCLALSVAKTYQTERMTMVGDEAHVNQKSLQFMTNSVSNLQRRLSSTISETYVSRGHLVQGSKSPTFQTLKHCNKVTKSLLGILEKG